jgi:toxin CcdB
MARFDVYRVDGTLVVDCQADLLRDLTTRFVVPLLPRSAVAKPAARLNPEVGFKSHTYVLMPQAAATVKHSDLGPAMGSLEESTEAIIGALDMLISGY